jgi:hypothetical protein
VEICDVHMALSLVAWGRLWPGWAEMTSVPCMVDRSPSVNTPFSFFSGMGFELRAYTLSLSASPFCEIFFRDRVTRTICLCWL